MCDCNGGLVCGMCLKDCDDFRHMETSDRVWICLAYCPRLCQQSDSIAKEVGEQSQPWVAFVLPRIQAGTVYQNSLKQDQSDVPVY